MHSHRVSDTALCNMFVRRWARVIPHFLFAPPILTVLGLYLGVSTKGDIVSRTLSSQSVRLYTFFKDISALPHTLDATFSSHEDQAQLHHLRRTPQTISSEGVRAYVSPEQPRHLSAEVANKVYVIRRKKTVLTCIRERGCQHQQTEVTCPISCYRLCPVVKRCHLRSRSMIIQTSSTTCICQHQISTPCWLIRICYIDVRRKNVQHRSIYIYTVEASHSGDNFLARSSVQPIRSRGYGRSTGQQLPMSLH